MDSNILDFAANEQAKWLRSSLRSATSAVDLSKNPSFKMTVLGMVQHSAETATKALAFGVGMSYSEVRRYSHDNLNLFCVVLNKILNERICIKPLVGITIDDDALKTLKRLRSETGRGQKRKWKPTKAYYEFKASMQVTSPAEVEVILSLLDEMDAIVSTAPTLMKKIVRESPSLEWEKGNTESLASQVVKTVVSGLGGVHGKFDPDAVVATLTINFEKNRELVELLEKTNPRIDFGEDFGVDLVPAPLNWSIALVKVFIIGGLAWPHQSSTRYPAPPCAPDDPEEAAKKDKMGQEHYTDEIGVILHIQKLSQILLDAVETLSRHANLNMSEESEETVSGEK